MTLGSVPRLIGGLLGGGGFVETSCQSLGLWFAFSKGS
jgi:hypothetical protein